MKTLNTFPKIPAGIAFAMSIASPLAAADPHFDGPYVGLDAARQNTIAGALVAGIDTLAQSTRSVASINAGYRMAFSGGVVAGVERNYGLTDGDLKLDDTANRLTIDYANSRQYGFGIQGGYAFGAESGTLVFAYLSETKRSFDVTIRRPLGVGTQRDKQRLLRYGVGLEQQVSGAFSIRGLIGLSRADFGSRRTNIDPSDKVDLAFGVAYQF
ncbi:MAG: porin family protein [Alphaproteobacteria bacterium]|nr:porin family protein [Alphaproteobacteria bacterium]